MTALVPTIQQTSVAIFETLMAEVRNGRRRETLLRLKDACDVLEAKGGSFKLADIQREVEKKHGKEAGPKAQSISNERKRSLGMYHYFEARERELPAKQPTGKNKAARRAVTATMAIIDRIEDMDTRSVAQDLYDRLVVAERGLERAKTLFKTLRPGIDPDRLIMGHGNSIEPACIEIPQEQKAALQHLLSILTDDSALGAVGLSNDGRRVRRKSGTRDELIDPKTLEGLKALQDTLCQRALPD